MTGMANILCPQVRHLVIAPSVHSVLNYSLSVHIVSAETLKLGMYHRTLVPIMTIA